MKIKQIFLLTSCLIVYTSLLQTMQAQVRPSKSETKKSTDASVTNSTMGHYKMRQNLASFGDDFWIEDNNGQHTYKVNGKMLRVRNTLDFEDTQGKVLVKIQEKMLRAKDALAIEDGSGQKLAEVKKNIISPVHDKWIVKIGNGPDIEVKGNILDYEYTIGEGNQKIAEVSKKWFHVADTYGVETAPGQNDVLILAIAVAIDAMVHPQK
jgi:uncharacterized protein YxjI